VPSIVGPFNKMIDPGWAIEWETNIAFVVGIVGEGFAMRIEIDSIGIAKSAGEQVPFGVVLP
jgi:hypothetical protein